MERITKIISRQFSGKWEHLSIKTQDYIGHEKIGEPHRDTITCGDFKRAKKYKSDVLAKVLWTDELIKAHKAIIANGD